MINLVFEDELSEHVLRKLLSCFDDKYEVGHSYNGNGFGYIKSKINGFNQACNAIPFLVLTDLDNSPCPLTIINSWLKHPIHPNMIFRIAIKEVEAWLLADTEGCHDFFGVSKVSIPNNPESENDPKKKLIDLAKRSRRRNIKDDIIPINDNAAIGPNYNGRLMEFVYKYWNVDRAMEKSDSLRRAYKKLCSFQHVKDYS